MTTFNGTTGDDSLTAIAGNDTYQLGNGNDTITYNASVDAFGVLTWNYGFDTIISTDGGVDSPNYDKVVLDFSFEYLWGRKVGLNIELSIYAHNVSNSNSDPGVADEVGKIIFVNAFSNSMSDRLSRLEGPRGMYFEAIASPTADLHGHTATSGW